MPRKKKEAAPELPEIRIQLATPMYGGQCTGVFVQSLLELTGMLSSQNIRLACAFMFNESLITRARNNLADQFLQTDNTHLLFIDADMKFRTIDILNMILADVDVITAICPKKEINWNTVREAALAGEENLAKRTGSLWSTCLPIPPTSLCHKTGPLRLRQAALASCLSSAKCLKR